MGCPWALLGGPFLFCSAPCEQLICEATGYSSWSLGAKIGFLNGMAVILALVLVGLFFLVKKGWQYLSEVVFAPAGNGPNRGSAAESTPNFPAIEVETTLAIEHEA